MDTLRLVPIPESEFRDHFRYDIFINNSNLINLVREIELPFVIRDRCPGEAGDYTGFNDYTLEHQIHSFLTDGMMSLLCWNGWEDEGWGLFVQITTTETTVSWSGFFNNNHSDKNREEFWDYSALGPFVFDKEQYNSEFTRERKKLFWPLYHDPREDYPFLNTNHSGVAKDGTDDENKS